MAANHRFAHVNPPEYVIEAVERQLREHAIRSQLRELVEPNLERIREGLAHDRKSYVR